MIPQIEIPLFPDGKRIAFTTSWDDGVVEDRPVVAKLNALGIKGTFNLNSGTFRRGATPPPLEGGGRLDVSEVAELYKGHEVAIHSVTHPWLPRLDRSQIAAEVLDDRKALEDLVGYPVRGMAYPYGAYDSTVIDVLRSLGIVYSRTVENRDPCFPPAEPLAWAATAHHLNLDVPEKWKALHGNPHRQGVFFLWAHSYEFARPEVGWDALDRIYAPLARHADVWYCTNIELFDYDAARRRLAIAANRKTAYNPSAIPVTVKAGDRLINVPAGRVTELVGTFGPMRLSRSEGCSVCETASGRLRFRRSNDARTRYHVHAPKSRINLSVKNLCRFRIQFNSLIRIYFTSKSENHLLNLESMSYWYRRCFGGAPKSH